MAYLLPLTKGQSTMISDKDYDRVLANGPWYANFNGRHWYAQKTVNKNGKNSSVRLHRFLLDAPAGMDVDHINGDTLDNRRENLRICTRSENLRNRSATRLNTSGFKGVSLNKRLAKWDARISVNKVQVCLGLFATKELAAMAYNEAAKKYFGVYAVLNNV